MQHYNIQRLLALLKDFMEHLNELWNQTQTTNGPIGIDMSHWQHLSIIHPTTHQSDVAQVQSSTKKSQSNN